MGGKLNEIIERSDKAFSRHLAFISYHRQPWSMILVWEIQPFLVSRLVLDISSSKNSRGSTGFVYRCGDSLSHTYYLTVTALGARIISILVKKQRISLGIFAELPIPSRWKWISKFERNKHLLIQHSKHEQWMRNHQQMHPSREIMFCLTGEHFYGFQGRVWKITPGTVLLIDKKDPHDESYSHFQPDCRDLWLHFMDGSVFTTNEISISGKKISRGNQAYYLIDNSGPFAETVTIAWEHCDQMSGAFHCLIQLKAAITTLLLQIFLHNDKHSHSPKWVADKSDIIDRIKGYVCAHLGEDLSLSTIATIAGYEATYFHRLFTKFAGESLHQYINRHRILKAKEMIRNGDKIIYVAKHLGFSSDSYFCRFFKREAQETPTEWMARIARFEEGGKIELSD